MSVEQERNKILQLLADGAISADEAMQLLNAAAQPQPDLSPDPSAIKEPSGPKQKPRWLNIHISNVETGQERVRVKLPLSLVRFGLQLGRKFTHELDELDPQALVDALEGGGEDGLILDVRDTADGEHVKLFVA